MRELPASLITKTVRDLCIRANSTLPDDVVSFIQSCRDREPWPPAQDILDRLLLNMDAARTNDLPLCQDTGMACVFLELGQEVHITGGALYEAVHQGVRLGYGEGFLRKSLVRDPLRRTNTGDNTPAMIHTDIVPGEKLSITVAPKGIGSENMSRIAMMAPSAGRQGVLDFVVESVQLAGPNPCPPTVVGVGIGGSFERVALLAKKALLRPLDQPHADPYYGDMELELLERINALGIGPQGFGGRTTALAVRIEAFPCHIGGLPAAVNLNCHVARHAGAVL